MCKICSQCGVEVLETALDLNTDDETVAKFRETINTFWAQEVTIDYALALIKFLNEYAKKGGINATSKPVRW